MLGFAILVVLSKDTTKERTKTWNRANVSKVVGKASIW